MSQVLARTMPASLPFRDHLRSETVRDATVNTVDVVLFCFPPLSSSFWFCFFSRPAGMAFLAEGFPTLETRHVYMIEKVIKHVWHTKLTWSLLGPLFAFSFVIRSVTSFASFSF